MGSVRTVRGDVDCNDLGTTLAHEHILYAYPGADLDHRTEFDLESVSAQVAGVLEGGLEEHGIGALVEMTPAEVYRHPPLMRAVSEASGVHVIAVTGFFPQSMGIPYYWRRQTVEELADFFIRDMTDGMMFEGRQTHIRAGAIKIATGGEGVSGHPSEPGSDGLRITEIEQRMVRAAARAQQALGCLVNTHTDPNDYAVTNPGIEQLDLLEDEGADPTKVVVGHAFIKNTGIDQLVAICERGATVNVDHIGIPWKHRDASELDAKLAAQVVELLDRGYGGQITFSYDRWFFNPRSDVTDLDPEFPNARVPWGYIFEEFIPRLSKLGVEDAAIQAMLVDNPKRLLTLGA